MLELVEVRKHYQGTGEVLTGVDLRVEPGSVTVVLGANGSGKSTLLRIAAGCSSPSSGQVRGRADVVGFLPPQFPASSRLTVRGYLGHLGAIHGVRDRDAEAVLDELGFSGSLGGRVSELSTGNAQKVGLAQALGAGAGLLVLDEPWTGLDDAAATVLDRLLIRRADRSPVLVADHSTRAAALPRAAVHRLEDGTLLPGDPGGCDEPSEPVTDQLAVGGAVEIVLRCRDDAERTLRGLPPADEARCRGRTIAAGVAAPDADRWLATALAAGCSVRSVTRRDEPPGAAW